MKKTQNYDKIEEIDLYFKDIEKYVPLTSKEESELAAKIKNGDKKALDKLVKANLKFVVNHAKQYRKSGVPFSDLISEGNIGLMKAASRFDGEKGVRFVNFAAGHVRRQIEKAIAQQAGLYQVPKDAQGDPSAHQQSKALSVDAPLGHRANMSLLSVLVNPDAPMADERVHSEAIENAIEFALLSLNQRESQVVNAYFGIMQEHETMAEIAEDMGVKREGVRQIRDKAIRKLRKAYKQKLKDLRAR
jgi:RNA polymerase primary sigma factor